MASSTLPTGNEPLNFTTWWESLDTTGKKVAKADGSVFSPVSSGQSMSRPKPPGLRSGTKTAVTDIEGQADYYSPDTYRRMLTFFSSCQFDLDTNLDFIPISQTKANPKLFVIGIIPPSAPVTGRLLDRSASITAPPSDELDFSEYLKNPPYTTVVSEGTKVGIVTCPGYTLNQGSGSPQEVPIPTGKIGPNGGDPEYTSLSVPQLWTVLGRAYKSLYSQDPSPTELQFYVAQSLRETGGKLPNNNFGMIGNLPTQPKSRETFRVAHKNGSVSYFYSYPSPEDGAKAFISVLGKNPNTRAAAKAGDALGYMTSLAQAGYYQEPVEVYYHGTRSSPKEGLFPSMLKTVSKGMKPLGVTLDDGTRLPPSAPDSIAFKESVFQYRSRVAPNKVGLTKTNQYRFLPDSPYEGKYSLGLANSQSTPPETNSNWTSEGSKNASRAKVVEAKTQGTDLNLTDVGKRFTQAQKAEVQETMARVEDMQNTPPLRLLVNPSSFKSSFEKIVSDGSWTRNGPIVEHWGDQQDKLEASGKLAAFLAIDANSRTPDSDGSSPGLTRAARNFSASYQNFLSLYLFYRNNGYLFISGQNEPGNKDNFAARLSLVGSVYIYYDNSLYLGSFDNFSITETDDKPYTLEYNFQFTVRATFLLDRPEGYQSEIQQMFNRPSLSSTTAALTR